MTMTQNDDPERDPNRVSGWVSSTTCADAKAPAPRGCRGDTGSIGLSAILTSKLRGPASALARDAAPSGSGPLALRAALPVVKEAHACQVQFLMQVRQVETQRASAPHAARPTADKTYSSLHSRHGR